MSLIEEEELLVPYRFETVLQTFLTLEPNLVINDVYIEIIISHLLGKYDKGKYFKMRFTFVIM